MNITGKMKVFKNNYGYSTTISSKNTDGEYDNMYISLQLPRGIEVEHGSFIEVTKGFLSLYKTKDGLPKIKIVVMEFDENEERKAIQNEQNYNTSDDDLPF